jgi:hypothetical protein
MAHAEPKWSIPAAPVTASDMEVRADVARRLKGAAVRWIGGR